MTRLFTYQKLQFLLKHTEPVSKGALGLHIAVCQEETPCPHFYCGGFDQEMQKTKEAKSTGAFKHTERQGPKFPSV